MTASPDPGAGPQQDVDTRMASLSELIAMFNETTERLRASHDMLSAKVEELSRELEIKNRLLERKSRLALMGQMAANVAHEIRNPLGGISLYVDLLGRDLKHDAQLLDIVQKIQAGVSGLNRIVEDMLRFTRMDNPNFQKVNLAKVLLRATSLIALDVQRKRVVLDMKMPEETDMNVEGDPDLLQQVMLNVLLNAVQASPVRAKVTISLLERDRMAEVHVVDRGAGIAKDDLPNLFDPFFTTKKAGTGLGLSIAHSIIEAHRGRIRVADTSETGTTMEICLPLYEGLRDGGQDRHC